MRSLSAMLLLGASLSFAHRHGHSSTRKSLSFGPVHPHRTFSTTPQLLQSASRFDVSSDPKDIARRFVEQTLLPDDPLRRHAFIVRDDSYTDPSSGVSHIYLRQLVNGVEVADGNINVNVLDGQVISYGDSFFKGKAPRHGVDPAKDSTTSQMTYCEELSQTLASLQLTPASEQVILGSTSPTTTLSSIYEHNCAPPYAPATEYVSPSHAVLSFLIAAHPDPEFSASLATNFESALDGIQSQVETHFAGTRDGQPYEQTVEFLHNVPGTVGPVRARLAYVQTPVHDCHTELSLVWKLEVEMENNWYEAAISTSDPQRIIEVVDWASDSGDAPKRLPGTYNVWKWGINDPDSGERSIEVSPYDEVASPWGWHSLPATKDPRTIGQRFTTVHRLNTTTTFGNNVFAHENWEGRSNWMNNYRPDAGKHLVFDYKYELHGVNDTWAEPKSYIDLAVTQLFYTSNKVHDLFYRYGFDEVAGNFQQFNFGKGGKDNDGVIANAQDGSGYNNANFMTPPDGQNGRMRMYVWNVKTQPYRDGDLEAGIVIHELAHGLSTRLTGGPADSSCLGWGESGGMGEGWGDFLATTIRSVEKYSDYPMGTWAANETRGIRNYPYSLNTTTNPSTYHTLDKGGYWGVHAIGEVWAEILFVVSNKLISKYGWSSTLFPPIPLPDGSMPDNDFYRSSESLLPRSSTRLVPKHGNSLIVQLVVDGMKLQPCRPGFFEARDAIIQADSILTGGENFCLLWEAFASRGLGVDATVQGRTPWGGGIRKDGRAVPKKCRTYEPEPEDPEDPEDPEEPGHH